MSINHIVEGLATLAVGLLLIRFARPYGAMVDYFNRKTRKHPPDIQGAYVFYRFIGVLVIAVGLFLLIDGISEAF